MALHMLTRMYADEDVTDPACVLCKYQQSSCSCTHHSLGLESPSHQPLHAPTRDSDGPGQTEAIMIYYSNKRIPWRDPRSLFATEYFGYDVQYDTRTKSDFERLPSASTAGSASASPPRTEQ